MQNIFNLTKVAKQRAAFRSVLLSGAFATGLSFPVLGVELQYYDPDAYAGLPTIANHNETYAFADIDNDGDQDAFHQNVFFENIGSSAKPSYEKRPDHLNPLANIPAAKLEFVDIDADGDLDVFTGSIKNGTSRLPIQWYENVGSAENPQYVENDTSQLGDLYENYSSQLTFVDIDEDGDQDVFLSGAGFYENTGTETTPFFTQKEVANFSALNTLMSENDAVPVFIDIDGDDDLDALYLKDRGEFTDLIYLENSGGAVYKSATTVSTFYRKNRAAWQSIDINNDTRVDLVINGIPFFNDGSLGIDAFDFKRLQIPLGMSFADLDGDSDLDAFLVAQESNKYKIRQYTNKGELYYSLIPQSWPGEHISRISLFSAQFIDLDKDDDLDQIVYQDKQIQFFENIGSAKNPQMEVRTGSHNPFSSIVLSENVLIDENLKPVFVDIDYDDDLDMFVLDSTSDTAKIIFYENIGNVDTAIYQQELAENPLIPNSGGISSFAFSDVDLDGDQDLLMTDSYELIFLENIGGKFNPDFVLSEISESPFKDIVIPRFIGKLKLIDLDENGYDDLIIDDNLLYLSRVINQNDDDNDGLPNDWENENGLDPNNKNDASLDGDMDGYSNLEEFYADTDPQDPTDYPGSSAQDPCQSIPIRSIVYIDNKHYNSTDDITCQASTAIALEGNVQFSSGTKASFNAPLIQLRPSVSIPYGSNVTFSSPSGVNQ